LIKHLKTINLAIITVSAAALFMGCGKETPHRDFIARVNKSFLSSGEMLSVTDSVSHGSFYRDEFIRNWINRELLYQQAVKEGITVSLEYKQIIEDSQKELAAALMIKKFYEDNNPEVDEKSLESYYSSHSELFSLSSDALLLNRINFNSEDKAIRFRTAVIESNWNKATNAFKRDAAVIINNVLFDEQEIHPAPLLRIVKELEPKEISIVLNTYENIFSVVQLLEKYPQGTIPPFGVIKDKVTARFVAGRKEMLLKDYLENLYSQNDIEIKK
jgi:hypothetical protein